ncbi:MAG TPA: tRNA lysidine(34) synthetase TilS [Saprospirales bacterium]|nr:tRNA lysidine(34) synthetase TilS [Saprospirales bacterium]
MEMFEEFFKFLKTQDLPFSQDQAVLLAVSGGLDSCVMVELFQRAGFPFAIAHVNFQLRGPESDQDEQFVQTLARQLDVPCFVQRVDTKSVAQSTGQSTQMAARNLRYAWFKELTDKHGFVGVCTAHHQNDSLETALLNFTRGTSLPGLSGIQANKIFGSESDFAGLQVFRPLLFAGRADLERFAKAQGLAWREDSSNAHDDYARNLIRHQVVPVLQSINPNLLETAARNMRRIRSADRNLGYLLQQFVQYDDNTIKIQKKAIAQLPSPRQALRQLLKDYGFDAEQTRQMAEAFEQNGLEWHTDKSFSALMDREYLLVFASNKSLPDSFSLKVQEDDLMLRLPDETRLFLMYATVEAGENPVHSDPNKITVDAEPLRFPLLLRKWQPGDTFQPLGMGGKHQKLQDFFTNQKLSRLEKEHVWVLTNQDGAIIWVLGMRLDERFKWQNTTKKVCNIHWIR